MAKEVEGEVYLTTEEVKQHSEFGWVRDTLYKAVKRGQLNGHRFFGDKRTYWRVSELQALKNKPEKIDPKDLPATVEGPAGRVVAACGGTLAAALA